MTIKTSTEAQTASHEAPQTHDSGIGPSLVCAVAKLPKPPCVRVQELSFSKVILRYSQKKCQLKLDLEKRQ